MLSSCSVGPEESLSERQQALTPAEQRVLAFDEVTDWEIWSGSGTIQNSTLHSEGTHSVAVSNIGYAGIRNATPLTKDEHPAPTVVGYDVWIPPESPNPTWRGDTQLVISAPSAGIHEQYLGYRAFQELPVGQFARVEFPLPDWIRQALNNTDYNDLRFVVAINAPVGSATHYVDRFILGPDPGTQTCIPIDDQNPCTADACDPSSGQTTHVPLAPDAMCSDGNACNGVELCDGAGTCQAATPPQLDDQNPCTVDSCDAQMGVSHLPVALGTSCSDNDACNGDEMCDGDGVCQAGTPPVVSDENPCTVDSCDPALGVVHDPAQEGSSCSDGDVCTGAETCDANGTCQSGPPPEVDDNNPCTADSCDPEAGVLHSPVAVGTSCDDGDLCNGTALCDGSGACLAASPPPVDDGNPCTVDSCDPALGVVHVNTAAGASCSDGNACNGAETCDGAGACQPGAAPQVDDGNPCTADACDPSGGVSHVPVAVGTSCADGNACNGAELCDAGGSCQAGTPVETDDGNPCTLGSCDPGTGSVTQDPAPQGVACGNGDLCDGSEFCDGSGTCEPGTAPQLDDGNLCTIDSCDPVFGVDHTPAPSSQSCSNENVCDGEEMCDGAGACAAGTPLDPDDDDPCTTDSCDPELGVEHTPAPAGVSCSNGNACDGDEQCDGAGVCTGGAPADTDDGNPCTIDTCDALTGVSHAPAPAGTSCDDGDVCNGADTCDGAGTCTHEGAAGIDDGNPCTVDTCNSDGTVTHELAPEGTSCDDGNACNGIEACDASGACLAATPPLLDDHNPCTDDWCDPETGVHNEPVDEGTACNLGTCQGSGTCSAEALCERTTLPNPPDNDPCTLEFCDETTGALQTVTCSEINLNEVTTVGNSLAFLYEGADPPQREVEPGTFDPVTVGAVRGRVKWQDGLGVANARVSVLGHPEVGWTRTQVDGEFVIAVPGGTLPTIRIELDGYPTITRAMQIPEREQRRMEDVVVVQRDHKVSRIQMNHSVGQWVEATQKSDAEGERTIRVYFPPGTQASVRLVDGTSVPQNGLNIRGTEYTVGELGPQRMPAELPQSSAYTFAAELTADEAIALESEVIEFDRTVYLYTENFLGFEIGTRIPLGYVDEDTGRWLSANNGYALRVEAIVDNKAVLSGLENVACGDEPDDEELARIAEVFEVGSEFWRSPMTHFSKWDSNQAKGPPEDAEAPPSELGRPDGDDDDPDRQCPGSRIDMGDGAVTQDLPLVGTDQQLHYSSRRERAFNSVEIRLTDETVPASLKRVELTVQVRGQRHDFEFSPLANQSFEFEWDGRDGMGRLVQGTSHLQVTRRFIYDAVYSVPERFGYNGNGLSITNVPMRDEMALSNEAFVSVGTMRHSETSSLTLSDHHLFDPGTGVLHRGDGATLTDQDLGFVATLVAGNDTDYAEPSVPLSWHIGKRATDVRFVIYSRLGYSFEPNSSAIARGPDGTLHVIAGLWQCQDTGCQVHQASPTWLAIKDGIITEATKIDTRIAYSVVPIVTKDGRRFVVRFLDGRVDELFPDGTYAPVADVAPNRIAEVQVAPDGQSLYIITGFAGSGNNNVVMALYQYPLSPEARVTAGPGGAECGDPPPTEDPLVTRGFQWLLGTANRNLPLVAGCPNDLASRSQRRELGQLAVAEDGTLFFSVLNRTGDGAICKLGLDGTIEEHYSGPIARFDWSPRGLYGLDQQMGTMYLLPGDGNVIPHAFSPTGQFLKTPLRALSAKTGSYLADVTATPDGAEQFVATRFGIWHVKSTMPRFGGDYTLSSEDGRELFVFDQTGRHQATRLRSNGRLVRSFQYDFRGALLSMQRHGAGEAIVERVSFQRDFDGIPQEILVDPDGAGPAGSLTHSLDVDDDGALLSLTNPAGESHWFGHEDANFPRLITSMTMPSGRTKTYSYDSKGRVTAQSDAPSVGQSIGGTFTYDYAAGTTDVLKSITRTTPSGQATVFARELGYDNREQSIQVYPDGTESSTVRDDRGLETQISRDGTSVTLLTQPNPLALPQLYEVERTTTLPESGLSHKLTSQNVGIFDQDDSLLESTESICIETTQGDLCTTTQYDVPAIQRTTTSPAGRVTTEVLDEIERVVQLQGSGSPTVRTVYDGDNVTAIVIDPDGIEASGDERTTQMVYSSTTGLLERVIDPLTHATLFGGYDAAQRPGIVTLPDSAQVQMTYDSEGNVATVTPPGKAPHGMTYGPYGRIESYSPPVGNAVQFFYDLDRRMDLIDFGVGDQGQPNQVDFAYDPTTGELSSITSPTGVIDVAMENGHMTTLSAPSVNGSIVTSIDYDGFLPTALSWSGPVAGEVQWTYNDRFLIETETIGALPETTVSYQYDADGLVTQAGDLTIQRDPASGRVLTKTIGNIRESFEYNEFAELSRQTVVLLDSMGAARETLYDVVYDDDGANGDRDALGRITKKTEWIVSGNTPNADGTARALDSRTYDYGYNPEGRPWLESVAVDGNVVSAYEYDENGNRIAAELSWSQLGYSTDLDVSLAANDTEYNAADQLLTYGSKSYTWNNFGQLESMYDSATDETTTYEYDLFGNLLSVGLPDGRTIEYDVDGAGRRVGRRELDPSGNEISFRGWIYRDLLRPIAEVDAMGNVVARYIYSDGDGARQNGVGQLATRLGANQDTSLPFSGSNVPEAIELLDAMGNVTQTLMLSTNQVGSVQLVTDASTGSVVQRIEYDSFGRVLSDSAPGAQPFGFAGGLYEPESELVRFGARDYSADVGRWIARDPMRQKGGSNLFTYVASDPNSRPDALGLKPNPPFWPPPISPWDAAQELCTWLFEVPCGPPGPTDIWDPFDFDQYDRGRGSVICWQIRQNGQECCGDGANPYPCPPTNDTNCDPAWQSCDDQCF